MIANVTKVTAFFLAVLGLVIGEVSGNPAARAMGDAFADVYEKVAPSVVVLEVTKPPGEGEDFNWESFFGAPGGPRRPRAQESEGSGFVIGADGYILTNAHVIAGADPENGVVARRQDGRRLPLKVVGVDEKTDLAVLKADVTDLPAVEWGNSDKVRVGEFVCGIGAPFELDYTLTAGVISAKGRSNLTSTVYEDYLQTDAAINPGNSGGPLVDLDGKVVGVNTLINRLNSSLGFAIPAKLAQTVSKQFIAGGRVVRPWLGIRIETLADQPALQKVLGLDNGVVVREIFANTPAARSELQPADVVVDVDGDPVASARDLQRAVLNKGIGATVNLKVWRRQDGDYRTVPVEAEELPPAPETKQAAARPRPFRPPAPGSEAAADPLTAFGLQVQDLPDEVAAEMSLPAGGVIVTHLEPGSPAALAGLKRRDVITAAGEDAVGNSEGLAEVLCKLAEGDGAVLLVERQGKETYAILKK